jgi:hypothetical protein
MPAEIFEVKNDIRRELRVLVVAIIDERVIFGGE